MCGTRGRSCADPDMDQRYDALPDRGWDWVESWLFQKPIQADAAVMQEDSGEYRCILFKVDRRFSGCRPRSEKKRPSASRQELRAKSKEPSHA